MPAQPLSKVRRNATVTILSDTLLRRPDLAALIAQTIAQVSSADSAFALVLSKLFHADYATIITIYEALTGQAAKRQLLLGAAAEKLPPDDLKLLQATLKAIKPVRDRRNEFAHHMWGECPELPDALLLVDQKMHVNFEVALRRFSDFGVMSRVFKGAWTPPPAPEIDRSRVFVYRAKELREVCDAAIAAEAYAWSFARYLNDGPESAEARRWLLNEAPVAQALQSLSQ